MLKRKDERVTAALSSIYSLFFCTYGPGIHTLHSSFSFLTARFRNANRTDDKHSSTNFDIII